MKINTKLSLFDYFAMINEIVLFYFNEDGTYQPQIGTINAQILFFNNCVIESKYDQLGHDIVDYEDMQDIIADEEFIEAFRKEVEECPTYSYRFGNAYRTAMEIISQRKTSFGQGVEIIKSIILEIVNKMNTLLTEDNLEIIGKLVKETKDESSESVIEALANNLVKLKNTEK